MAISGNLERLFRQPSKGGKSGTDFMTALAAEVDVLNTAQTVSGVKTYTASPQTTVDVGAKNGAAVSVVEQGTGQVHKTVLTLTALSVTMTDAGAAGSHGSHKVYDFPAGPIQVLGCSYNLAITAGAGGIADGAAVVGALGTVTTATDNAALTTTEADLIASTAGTLTAGVGALAKHGSIVTTAFDGTATAKDAYLNLAVPDADSSANDTIAVTGTITICWINLGDY
jgi:hypothetical protein